MYHRNVFLKQCCNW